MYKIGNIYFADGLLHILDRTLPRLTNSIQHFGSVLMCYVKENIESSKGEHKAAPGRYLTVNERPIIWDHWEGCFRFNCQSGFRIHRSLTKEHLVLTPASKMRNKLATDVLSKDMLYLMKEPRVSGFFHCPARTYIGAD